jgi:hypothetical protein
MGRVPIPKPGFLDGCDTSGISTVSGDGAVLTVACTPRIVCTAKLRPAMPGAAIVASPTPSPVTESGQRATGEEFVSEGGRYGRGWVNG